ncbi:MAG: hypothetical protein U1E83_07150 [Methylotetracoccus sp.]
MNINLVMANVLKFAAFVLFTFMVLVYFGFLILLPLDVLTQLIKIFSAFGLPTVIAALLGAGGVGYLGYTVYRMPELCQLILDIGMQLVQFGLDQLKRFDPLIEAARAIPQKTASTA